MTHGVWRKLMRWDRRAYLLGQGRWRARRMNRPMVWITTSGTKGTVWIALAGVVFLAGGRHGRATALLSIAALLAAEGAINLVLKPIIARERPYVGRGPGRLRSLLVAAPGAHSWPSAHAGSSMAAALVLAYGYTSWAVAFLALALLIGYSRVYVGVHYPLDVLAGFILGLAAASLVLLGGSAVSIV